MTTRFTTLSHGFAESILRLALLGILIATTPLFASDKSAERTQAARLVQLVRNATKDFQDVRNVPAGYGPFLGCVSGPDHGAMGVHYVNGDLVGDGKLEVAHPEALIYETLNGQTKLVGVEYIVDAATWLAHNDNMIAEGSGDTATARLRPVELGAAYGNQIAITKGVTAGDRVITTGVTLIKNGDTVQVVP